MAKRNGTARAEVAAPAKKPAPRKERLTVIAGNETSDFVTTSFSAPRELLEELHGAMHALMNQNRSGLITEAVERLLVDLRTRHNGGKPFPPRAEQPGRRRYRSRFNLTPDR